MLRARRGPAEAEQNIEIVRLEGQRPVECGLRPVVESQAGAGEAKQIKQARIAFGRASRIVQHPRGSRPFTGPVQGLRSQQ